MKAFIIALATTLLLDFLWLGFLMSGFYKNQIGTLMRVKPNGESDLIFWAAGMVYLLLALGITLFVLPKAANANFVMVPVWGFIFGVIVYGVYDFTNLSILQGWTLPMTFVDIFWGGVLCATVSAVTFFFTRS